MSSSDESFEIVGTGTATFAFAFLIVKNEPERRSPRQLQQPRDLAGLNRKPGYLQL